MKTAGGFAGMLEGQFLVKKDKQEAGISVNNIRSVIAGEYAGGCFGVADVEELQISVQEMKHRY